MFLYLYVLPLISYFSVLNMFLYSESFAFS